MSAPRIPDRQPIGDCYTGIIMLVDGYYLLADSVISGYEATHEGDFIVRYGVVYLGKPHLSIVPDLMALDYGAFKTGDDAWDFLLNKSTLYPRADIFGYNNSGNDSQAFVRELDLMYPFDILVYADATQTAPLCKVDAIISNQPDGISNRLAEYANIFPSVDDWKKAIQP
ncbi:MAG: hypothetical protein WBC91_18865 [Phototrophicaceae bacterium]